MSSERLPPVIDLAIRPSPALACLCAAAHVLAIAAVVLSGLVWPARALLIFALLSFAAWWIVARALALAPDSILRLVWRADGECEWRQRSGQWHRGSLMPGVLVHPALVVIRLRAGRRSRTLCLARDSVDAEALRRLRTRLRVSPPPLRPRLARRLAGWLSHRSVLKRSPGRLALDRRREIER